MTEDSITTPLLGSSNAEERARPLSRRSDLSSVVRSDESTPLLSRENEPSENGNERINGRVSSSAASSLRSLRSHGSTKGRRRWPTILALSSLSVVVVLIMAAGFFAPAIVEQYAKQAVVFEPTDLSIHSFTTTGVRARVQGDFTLDASRVHGGPVRNLGRFGTWIARKAETRPSTVKVSSPELDVVLGTATIPGIVVDLRNGQTTHVDFVTDLEPGQVEGIRRLANDWIEGRLAELHVQGVAEVSLKSGIFSLGTQTITQSMIFKGHDIPALPKFNVTNLSFHEVKSGKDGASRAMQADAVVTLFNRYPLELAVPKLGFDILVPNCLPEDPYILLGQASTAALQIKPNANVNVPVEGLVRSLPDVLITTCPNSQSSPLDILLGEYIHGEKTTIFVRGAKSPSRDTPAWISDLISSVVVPLPFPGHTFDNLIKNFSLSDVHFGLPNPVADPGTPEAQPRLSAVVQAIVALPRELNFSLDVSQVRADANVFYKGKMLGVLDLHKWQKANATRLDDEGETPTLVVRSIVVDAPLNVTDDDVFTEVIQAIFFGGKGVVLGIKANVDVDADTPLGGFVIRKIPAEGKVVVKPISGGGVGAFSPEIGNLNILSTTTRSVTLESRMNFTNPTKYSASVPYFHVNILNNKTLLGYAVAKDVVITPGRNEDILIKALWDPSGLGGHNGTAVGRELLSQYISGWNTTLTLKAHEGTIPSQPMLGRALSFFDIEIPTPKLKTPHGPDDGHESPHFIEDATMHLFTSTATFTLLSPLPHTTIYITHINATALYNHTDPVGNIIYDLPFAVPPGAVQTPRLPVDWSLGSVGYEAVKSALGGTLKVDARAIVGIKIGNWSDSVWYSGKGIGAKIRI